MQNFDEVLVPADHVSRNPNDTYYIDTETVLRCHTSAHQAETLRKGKRAFLVTGVENFHRSVAQSVHEDPETLSYLCSMQRADRETPCAGDVYRRDTIDQSALPCLSPDGR